MYLSQIDLNKPRAKFYHIGSPSNVLNTMANCTTAIFLICLLFAFFLSAKHGLNCIPGHFESVFILKTGQPIANLIKILICFDQLHSLKKVRGS